MRLAAAFLLRFRAISLGIKSLRLHPMRSLLTVLGIFVGVASVIWLLAIGEGISEKAQQQIADLGANNILLQSSRPQRDPSDRQLRTWGISRKDYRLLKRIVPTIDRAAPTREYTRSELRYRDRLVLGRQVGCTPEYLEINRLELARGHFVSDIELDRKSKVCVLGAEVAKTLFKIDDPIGRSIRIDANYYRVIGVIRERPPSSGLRGAVSSQDYSKDVYVPITTYWARANDYYARTGGGIPLTTRVTLQVRSADEVLETADAVRKCLADWHEEEDYQIIVPLELLEQARSTRLMFIMLMGLIAAISLVVGGIGVMNIMLATVTERTREIGIRRALGATRWDITRQFLIETVLLCILGGLTGIAGGLSCRPVLQKVQKVAQESFPQLMESMPESLQEMTPVIVPWSIPLAFGISMAVGVIFGIYPAIRAARMNPIEALRHSS